MIERVCNKCGSQFFAKRNAVCPGCSGTMCRSVRLPLHNQTVGILCRDRHSSNDEITLFKHGSLTNTKMRTGGTWYNDDDNDFQVWTAKQWQRRYGKLPQKGSKEAVILEM